MEEVRDLRMDEREGAGAMLDELMRKIPGYEGYREREKRRSADQKQREFVSKRLTAKKRTLQNIGETLMSTGGMKHLKTLDSLTNKIDRVVERSRHASAGASSLFDTNVIDTERLDIIYEHDLALLRTVEEMDSLLSVLESAAECNDNVADSLRKVREQIDEVDAHLDKRDKILKGLE